MTLTVSVPHYRTPPKMLRRVVDSILNQTFRDLIVVAVNDGDDPEKAWKPLADIDDPRLIRFDLDENRGRYYVDAVVAKATQTEWWSTHDSDDWSEPHRFKTLLKAAEGHDAAFSECLYHKRDGSLMHDRIKTVNIKKGYPKTIARYPAGIYRTEAIQAMGIHPSIRLSHDTAIVQYIFHRHRVATVNETLYHVVKRQGSLTTDPETKNGTRTRQEHRNEARRWLNHRMQGVAYPSKLRTLIGRDAQRLEAMIAQ